jgi:hypothetical protein
MASIKRRYDKQEFARRGDEVFAMQVGPRLTTDDEGRFAAVDIETGAYEIDEDELVACDKLNARVPRAQTPSLPNPWTISRAIQIGPDYVQPPNR